MHIGYPECLFAGNGRGMSVISPFSLAGKTILVTGASSGIGRSCAQMISAMGGRLILSARSESRLKETQAQLVGQGHLVSPLDLLDNLAIHSWVERQEEVDGVVHAAGVARVAPFRLANEQHIDELMQVNFKAPVLITQAMLKMKKIKKNASLVFISAVAEHIAPAGTAMYSASKAALYAAVRSLALETAKHKIRANCVSPGYVGTPMLEGLLSTTSVDNLQKLSHLGLIHPDEVAASVVYLLSDAARWVTRTKLVIDGGLSVPVR